MLQMNASYIAINSSYHGEPNLFVINSVFPFSIFYAIDVITIRCSSAPTKLPNIPYTSC